MEVTFTRTGERRYGVYVRRPRFPPVVMDPAPSYDADLPHDFVHFVVEQELGLERGVFGQLAAGGDAGTFRLAEAPADPREASRQRRRQARRGGRHSREGHEAAELSERAATVCHYEWLARSAVPHRRAKAREMEAFVGKMRREHPDDETELLSEEVIERVCGRLDELAERWSRVEVGRSVTLRWAPARRGGGSAARR